MTTQEAIDNLRLMMNIKPEEEKTIRMAMNALEKQVPMKPIKLKHENIYQCKSCNRVLRSKDFGKPYCNCGQKLDWEVVE